MATVGKKEIRIVVSKDGNIRFVYDDALMPFLQQGQATIKRASHVEPSAGGWTADMSPVKGPVLGPFETRQLALAAETQWLKDNNIPVPE